MLSTVAVGDSYLVLVHLFGEKSQFAICNNNSTIVLLSCIVSGLVVKDQCPLHAERVTM